MNGSDSDEENAMAYFLPNGIADDSPPKRRCVSTPLGALYPDASMYAVASLMAFALNNLCYA